MGRAIRVLLFAGLCVASLAGVWWSYQVGVSALGTVGGVLAAIVAVMLSGALVMIVGAFWFTRPSSGRADRTQRTVRDRSEQVERENA
jgi:hypothetical protein